MFFCVMCVVVSSWLRPTPRQRCCHDVASTSCQITLLHLSSASVSIQGMSLFASHFLFTWLGCANSPSCMYQTRKSPPADITSLMAQLRAHAPPPQPPSSLFQPLSSLPEPPSFISHPHLSLTSSHPLPCTPSPSHSFAWPYFRIIPFASC